MVDITRLFSDFLPQNVAPTNTYYDQLQRTYNQILPGQPLDTAALQNWYGNNQGLNFGGTIFAPPAAPVTATQTSGGLLTGTEGGSDSDQQASDWSALSPSEQAAFYSANPVFAAITQALQGLFGETSYGRLQQTLFPAFVEQQRTIARGVDPNGMAGLSEQERSNVNQALSGYLESSMNQPAPSEVVVGDPIADLGAVPSDLPGLESTVAYDSIGFGSYGENSPGGSDTGGLGGQGASADTGTDGIGF